MKSFLEKLGFYILFSLLYLVSILPMWLLYGFSYMLYVVAFYIFGYRRSVVVQNLSRSFPEMLYGEIRNTCRKFFKTFFFHFAEIIKSTSISSKKQLKKVEFIGFDIAEEYIKQGKSVIACMGHCANWEMLNVLPRTVGFPICAGYKPLENNIMDRLMKTLRSRFGVKPIPSNSLARHILGKEEGAAMYYFLADQSPMKVDDKYWITFLHQPTGMFPGAEKLAKASGSAVVFLHMTQVAKGRYRIECKPMFEDAKQTKDTEIIKQYAKMLEDNIYEQPWGWLWSHRRWKRPHH